MGLIKFRAERVGRSLKSRLQMVSFVFKDVMLYIKRNS